MATGACAVGYECRRRSGPSPARRAPGPRGPMQRRNAPPLWRSGEHDELRARRVDLAPAVLALGHTRATRPRDVPVHGNSHCSALALHGAGERDVAGQVVRAILLTRLDAAGLENDDVGRKQRERRRAVAGGEGRMKTLNRGDDIRRVALRLRSGWCRGRAGDVMRRERGAGKENQGGSDYRDPRAERNSMTTEPRGLRVCIQGAHACTSLGTDGWRCGERGPVRQARTYGWASPRPSRGLTPDKIAGPRCAVNVR